MRWKSCVLVCLVLGGCGNGQADGSRIVEAQAKSLYGPTAQWKLDPAVSQAQVQEIRNRGYTYCLAKKPTDTNCANQQDHSVFMYASAFGMVRIFRSEAKPTFPYAMATSKFRRRLIWFADTACPFTKTRGRATRAVLGLACQQASVPTSLE